MSKVRHYGPWQPWVSFFRELTHYTLRRVRTLWRLRRLEVGRRVKIASSVEVFGSGRILVEDGAQIGRRCVLIAEAGSEIRIGAGAVICEHCRLIARANQVLVIGSETFVAEFVVIDSVAGIHIGSRTFINRYSEIGPRELSGQGKLTTGEYVQIQNHTILDLTGDVTIADHVRLGPFCAIYTHNHDPEGDGLIWTHDIERLSVSIEQEVWIGQACILLAGVRIASQAIVAAGAVVTRDVPPRTIVGGIPAKVIRAI